MKTMTWVSGKSLWLKDYSPVLSPVSPYATTTMWTAKYGPHSDVNVGKAHEYYSYIYHKPELIQPQK